MVFPPPNEVFLVDLGDDGFHRAVCSAKVSIILLFVKLGTFLHFSKQIHYLKDNNAVLLIDIGHVMEITAANDLEIYSLSEKAQQMSARAIPCKVVEVGN